MATKYSATPINNGTRIREGHDVWSPVIKSIDRGVVVEGTEVWEAPANGSEVVKGDKWLLVTSVGGVPVTDPRPHHIAIVHKGLPICNNFKEIVVVPPPNPDEVVFPESFDLTDPSGVKARYEFVRILEE